MFQVPLLVKIEVERWEISRMHHFDLLAVLTAVLDWAVEWTVNNPLGACTESG